MATGKDRGSACYLGGKASRLTHFRNSAAELPNETALITHRKPAGPRSMHSDTYGTYRQAGRVGSCPAGGKHVPPKQERRTWRRQSPRASFCNH